MNKVVEIFTPARRQQIQLFLGSLAPLLILGGFATQAQTEQGLIIAGAVLQFLAALLALVNIRRGDWGAGWTVIRGAIYALAATVSPALVFFGLYDEATNAVLLTGISLALSSLSALLAIFIGKTQELNEVKAEVVAKNIVISQYEPLHEQGRD